METGIAVVTPQHVIGHFDCLSFAVFRAGISIEALQALDENHMSVFGRSPKVCTLVIAEGSLSLPPHAVRAESARLMRLRANTQLCSCTVIEGGGFAGAAARGVLTAIQLLSSHAYPLHTASTLAEACSWTASKAARSSQWSEQLRAFVTAARGSKTSLLPLARSVM